MNAMDFSPPQLTPLLFSNNFHGSRFHFFCRLHWLFPEAPGPPKFFFPRLSVCPPSLHFFSVRYRHTCRELQPHANPCLLSVVTRFYPPQIVPLPIRLRQFFYAKKKFLIFIQPLLWFRYDTVPHDQLRALYLSQLPVHGPRDVLPQLSSYPAVFRRCWNRIGPWYTSSTFDRQPIFTNVFSIVQHNFSHQMLSFRLQSPMIIPSSPPITMVFPLKYL